MLHLLRRGHATPRPGVCPLLALCLALFTPNARAQEQDGDDVDGSSQDYLFADTIVTATRFRTGSFEAPYSTAVIDADQIARRSYRTTPQILRDTPGVMIQETSNGQGSPYIRGFTGYRNLFLIDGVRLNNSVFRSGPNQYWNTVDPQSIERLEIVKGPTSVLWGSDAVGGTVNAITKNPYTYGPGTNAAGSVSYRYASAEDSHIGRTEVSVSANESLGLLVSASGKSFGDVEAGSPTGTQPNTGYGEWNANVKVETFLDAYTHMVVAYQRVRQIDVPRTHKTVFAVPFEGTTIGSDLKRDLTQKRELGYVQLHGDNGSHFFDRYNVSLSWHEQTESRDRIRGSGSPQKQGFDVATLGFFANASTPTSIGRITVGFDAYHDEVDSYSSSNPIQGPVADDARYDLVGVFAQDEIDVSKKLALTLGARWNWAAADANSVLEPVSGGRISLDDRWSSVVGSARFLYRLSGETLNLFGGVSQGFRAPNLSDLTRFDSARTNEFEIPAPGLDAEEYLSYELGIKAQEQDLSAELSCFYTDIKDQIVRVPTGNTNTSGEFEITKDNVGDGYVWGVEVGAAQSLAPQWTVFGNATYTKGKVETYPTSANVKKAEYLDRLMPLTAQLGARWEDPNGATWFEAVSRYADDADRLSTRDTSDTSRIPPGGTPGYLVFHVHAGWRFNENVTLRMGVENLFDEDYRIHGSGQNMPGRSLVLSVVGSL